MTRTMQTVADDDDVLRQLPENGSVADRIPNFREGRQDRDAMPVGPGAAAADGEGENEDKLRDGGGMVTL
jgi:hypothetical protein